MPIWVWLPVTAFALIAVGCVITLYMIHKLELDKPRAPEENGETDWT